MILLPVPPSANTLFIERKRGKNGKARGRFPSPEYTAWKEHAGLCIKTQRPQPLRPSCKHIALSIVLPDSVRGDIDNRVKGLADLLVAHGLIPDDRYVQKLTVERMPRIDDNCQIQYWPLEQPGRGA